VNESERRELDDLKREVELLRAAVIEMDGNLSKLFRHGTMEIEVSGSVRDCERLIHAARRLGAT